MIKALIFDWHGVLDHTKFELLVLKLATLSGLHSEVVKERIASQEREYARGTIPADEFWDSVQEKLHLSDNQLREAKGSILQVKLNTELWEDLESLSQKYTLAILSVCPLDKVQIIRREVDLSLFTAVHFSAEKNLLKSDDKFFLNLTDELDLSTHDCFYIDDSEKHIQTAERLGFESCLFLTHDDLKKLV